MTLCAVNFYRSFSYCFQWPTTESKGDKIYCQLFIFYGLGRDVSRIRLNEHKTMVSSQGWPRLVFFLSLPNQIREKVYLIYF